MLVLVTLLLAALLVATAVIWLFRIIVSRRNTNYTLGVAPSLRSQLYAQQGYIKLDSGSKKALQKRALPVKLRSASGELKAPWGW